MIDVAVLRAMAAAGAGVDAIIAAVAASQMEDEETIRRRRELGRQRQQKRRNAVSRDVTRSHAHESENATISNTVSRDVTRTPLETPIKNLPSEDSKILDFAGARPEESKEGFGYSNFDGTVSFTAAEITALSLECYTMTNVYGQVRSLAESSWVTSMRPTDRKRAIMNKIRKDHSNRVRSYAPTAEEQEAVAKQAAQAQREEQERATQVRERILGGRHAG